MLRIPSRQTSSITYYRQDFWKKMAFYVGKIHPNEFISLVSTTTMSEASF